MPAWLSQTICQEKVSKWAGSPEQLSSGAGVVFLCSWPPRPFSQQSHRKGLGPVQLKLRPLTQQCAWRLCAKLSLPLPQTLFRKSWWKDLTSGRTSAPSLWKTGQRSSPVRRQQRKHPDQRGRSLFFHALVSADRSSPESKRQFCFCRAEALSPWMTGSPSTSLCKAGRIPSERAAEQGLWQETSGNHPPEPSVGSSHIHCRLASVYRSVRSLNQCDGSAPPDWSQTPVTLGPRVRPLLSRTLD